MRLRLIALAPLVILGMIACSKPKVAPAPQPVAPVPVVQHTYVAPPPVSNQVYAAPMPQQPAWVDLEEDSTGLVAVGIASRNPLDDKGFQREVAIADARNKMAGKMKVRVQHMFTSLNQTMATANQNKVSVNSMQRVQEGVTRQLINIDLEGANPRYFWRDPGTGDLYVQVYLANDKIYRDMSRYSRQFAQGDVALDHALDKLDAAIGKGEIPTEVVQ